MNNREHDNEIIGLNLIENAVSALPPSELSNVAIVHTGGAFSTAL